MKWKTKWMTAIILTIGVIGVAKLEEAGLVKKPVTQYVTTGKDFIVLKKWVASLIGDEKKDTIAVTGVQADEVPFASYESMQPYEDGVIVSYKQPMTVQARGDGLVVFTGSTRQSGKTVTVLYDDGDEVTYGFVGSISKLPYTTVKKGDTLALMNEETMYLQVKREGITLDPSMLATYFSEPADAN
ncbi:peptidoglycan DD-metalloendopeptidase family protein [Sporosarcina sp. Te-1]|uniref:peptidoglycan DD-metalloendopeptidase family protein n=1 Tax=Sporosarcina sp. Te-1 TaxID=2818390 RepID=UPI001A9E0709|nr:peptidoglycan DD-metalloendopeptidase family protein [Sporosarcina sp. Te-1]QTD41588.1 peptidoglycan DD-metalloendopeptidase family protein [Sporosarcina sp. Te-1]